MRQNIPNYLRNEDSEEEEVDVSSCQCTIWIRSSTGRLSAELALPHRDNETSLAGRGTVELRGPTSYDPSNLEAIAIHALSLGDYHTISCFHFTRSRFTYISTAASVTPGVVVYWPRLDRAHYHDGGEIASLPELYHYPGAWLLYPNPQVEESWLRGNLLENGWMRFSANDSFNKKITLCVDAWLALECLLTQANYIFSSMHIESNLENYGFVKAVYFRVVVPQLTVDCPPGYLFLCPPQDFQVGTSSFKWPDSPAYWSLDPLGHERLSTGEATRLGFPSLELATSVHGVFWDTSVYAGLRQFYRAKGFDAESQDVAEHLGHPLFRLSAELKSPSTHVGKYRNWGSNRTQHVGPTKKSWHRVPRKSAAIRL
ncbi:hypothetical protein C8R46DRAFT_240901 [Mycena filopes]|nr:hypothetical protein C8R46DRAFT_240901 [Mycena filopes]